MSRPTHHNAFGRQHAQQLSSPSSSKMAICYRDISGDGVPVVAHVPQRPLTFREFRHYLSISSKDRRQFFFKSTCEDGSAPYQLLLISDDVTFLPVFEGKVSAECHAPLSDSD
uniref:DIX domain-containing protein n=1 Tax=Globodera rostochiensis TaxID=31243 RepID=A0A914GWA3_GLORO